MSSECRTLKVEELTSKIFASEAEMADSVAEDASEYLTKCLKNNGSARVILATGNSQIQFLNKLSQKGAIDGGRVTFFHMDEYLGLSSSHSASFCRYLRERVEEPMQPKVFHYLNGENDLPLEECRRYSSLLREAPIDLCCLGIGENGHLAFNDPHVASFVDQDWVKLVRLDHECKEQQVNEGHFPSLDAVPPFAYTLSIPALCSAKKMLCVAPEKRKAQAVKAALEGPVDESCPASFLRQQAHATLFLDADSASLLSQS